MTVKRSDVEIMAPVGCYESLAAAVQAGADSIYFGVEQLNMRARSSFNFTLDDLSRIVSEAGRHGIKTYLTVNTILYDEDLPEMRRIMDRARSEGVDAVIASPFSTPAASGWRCTYPLSSICRISRPSPFTRSTPMSSCWHAS